MSGIEFQNDKIISDIKKRLTDDGLFKEELQTNIRDYRPVVYYQNTDEDGKYYNGEARYNGLPVPKSKRIEDDYGTKSALEVIVEDIVTGFTPHVTSAVDIQLSNLGNLGDVQLTTPIDSDILTFDSGKWKNKPISNFLPSNVNGFLKNDGNGTLEWKIIGQL